jgi:hypothetical protein
VQVASLAVLLTAFAGDGIPSDVKIIDEHKDGM